MISSVIAKLNCDEQTRREVIQRISRHSSLEVGELIEETSLPISIESSGNQETEELTRWIMSLEGVDFVDVVYVHFEDDDLNSSNAGCRKPKTENQSL